MGLTAPIRIGIIGLGRAGWGMHRPEVKGHGGYQIVAGADLRPERCERLQAEEPGAKGYTNYLDLLDDDNVDLVAVATRSNTHAQVVIDALNAGKHVVAEKPFACSLAEADAIIEAAANAPGKLLVRHNRNWDADFLAIAELVASGKLGKLQMVRLCRHGYQRRADWQTIRAYKGGQLNNWGPHIIHHALALIGAPVVDVWSDLRNIAGAGDAEDHLMILIRGANGVVADVEISGGVALGNPVWHLIGDQGALTSDGRTIRLRWYDRASMAAIAADHSDPPVDGGFGNAEPIPWQDEEITIGPAATDFYTEVYRALVEDKPFDVTLEQARAVVEVTEWARVGTAFE
ncbi:MAG: Gfo/Idh/MocA family oxidoreductase [Armatimonadetes bacterium]|nr:Gfo/Idh/MocA family oxidoreductase [Armatimonadota bacterium]